MKTNDKRIAFLDKISLNTSRVDLRSPIVFLCGGLVNKETDKTSSIRHAFLNYISRCKCDLVDKITLAEDFEDWIHDSIYSDLLDFENDIAHIASLIVIMLESPGALTELGFFVKNETLNKKLIVFVNDEHYDTRSFVKLGPLKYLESIRNQSVCAYPWDTEDIEESLSSSLPEMHQDLLSAISSMDNSETFNSNNDGHVSFALYEIINIFLALKITEIEKYSKHIGLNLKREKTNRLLFLLTKFKLIANSKRGNNKYYYSLININKINFGGHFDKIDARMSTMNFYRNSESESARVNFIKMITKESSR